MSDMGVITLRVKTDGVATADAALRRLGTTGTATEGVMRSFSRSSLTASSSADDLSKATSRLDAAFIGLISVATIKRVTEMSDEWTNLTNKLKLNMAANDDLASAQSRVFDIAQVTRTSLSAVTTLYTRLERSMTGSGRSAEELGKITSTINKAMLISGATAAETSGSMIQLSQALNKGVLNGDEFNSIAEQAPRIMQALSNYLGLPIAALKKMGTAGKLTSDMFIRAMEASADSIDKEFGRTLPTFEQNMTIATNNVIKFFGESVKGQAAVKTLGDAIIGLSENMGTITTVATILASILTSRLIVSFAAKTQAVLASAVADQAATVSSRALQAVMTSAVGVTAAKATADRVAAATALQLARSQAIVAKGTVEESAAKIQLTSATVAYRTALISEIAAKQALGSALGTATVATGRFTAAIGLARGALGLIGGPVGVVMLAVTALIAYNEAQSAAVTKNNEFADSADSVISKLVTMTDAQRAATAARAEDSIDGLTEEYKKAQDQVAYYTSAIANYTATLKSQNDQGIKNEALEAKLEKAHRLLAVATEAAETAHTRLSNAQRLVLNATLALNPAVASLYDWWTKLSNVHTPLDGSVAVIDGLNKKLNDATHELQGNTLAMNGSKQAASVYKELLKDLGKDSEQYAQQAMDIATGKINEANATDGVTKKLVQLGNVYAKNYQAEQAIANSRKKDHSGEQWVKQYERVTAAGADALDKINIQQDAELRKIEASGAKAKASVEDIEIAKAAIREKYAKQTQDLVDKYNDVNASKTAYTRELKDITALEAAKLLTVQEGARARQNAEDTYLQARLAQTQKYAVSERDQLKATYDPVQEAMNTYTSQLAVLDWYHQNGLVKEKEYGDQRHALYTTMLQEQAVAQNKEVLTFVQSASTTAGNLATVIKNAGAESSAAYKVLFAASQAFAIANATLNLSTAISQALADPTALTPAQKFANMAAVAAAGTTLLSAITSATMTGMAHDGITEIPKEGTWLLQKGERVLSAQQNSDFTNFMRSGSTPSQTGSTTGSAGVTIHQNISVAANGDAQLKQMMQQAAQQGAEMGYNKSVSDVSNQRGAISRAIGR